MNTLKTEREILKVGQAVTATKDIVQGADEYSPGGIYAKKGTVLIIREVSPEGRFFQYYVSHERVLDNSFGVKADEIKALEQTA
ncbi:hypothetical protein [Alkanindiges illinoisensis]|uniref:hypothetical protein n=1 Tax=Alkanindiges illinoisensis TaxID=197183 RepID=UPI00047B6EFD|nr:hypothetical protein [Alkanindiges illinoisensis]